MSERLRIFMLCVAIVAVITGAIIGVVYLAQGYLLPPCQSLTDAHLNGWHAWDGKRVRCVLGSPVQEVKP